MGPKVMKLVEKYQRKSRPIWFDANVNYYQREGFEYYQGMFPSDRQQAEAIQITKAADGVIADSEYLLDLCRRYNERVCWIADNVHIDYVPPYKPWKYNGKRLPLLWSGESVKLFELLLIENVLKKYSNHIELVLITNDLSSWEKWHTDYIRRFQTMLLEVPYRIVPYRDIMRLFMEYGNGGVFISPRHLNNTYNFGHSEWKITLPMACGRMVICSPVPSYLKVWERARGSGIRICRSDEHWEKVIDEILTGRIDIEEEENAAKMVVEKYYSTKRIAAEHINFIRSFLEY